MTDPTSHRRSIVYAVVLVALGFGVYLPSLTAPFLLDDISGIVNAPHLQRFWPIGGPANRPTLVLSLALNHAMAGPEPWVFRLTNVTIHVLAALLLFGIVRRILRGPKFQPRIGPMADVFAFSTAAIWAVHPVQTQAVTYIWQRSESMMGMFFLLTIYCLQRASTSPRKRSWTVAALLATAIGLGSKEVMIAVIPMALVCDSVLFSESCRDALRQRRWLYAVFAVIVLGGLLIVLPNTSTSNGQFSTWEYARSQPGVILDYVRIAFWPSPLSFDYGLRPATGFMAIVPPALIVLAALGASAWALWRRSWLGVVGAWFFVILAPTSSVIVINDIMVEYRVYLPLAALAVLFVAGARILANRLGIPMLTVTGVAIAALAITTVARNRVFMDRVELWRATTEVSPENFRAWFILSAALAAEQRWEESIEIARKAIRLDPDHAPLRRNIGRGLFHLGQFDEALQHFQHAQRSDPRKQHMMMIGQTQLALKDLRAAAETFREFVEAWPDSIEARKELVATLSKLGEHDEALAAADELSEHGQADAGAWAIVGRAAIRANEAEAAIRALQKAIEMAPDEALPHCNLGQALLMSGSFAEAVDAFRRSLRRDPYLVHTVARFAEQASVIETDEASQAVAKLGELVTKYSPPDDAAESIARRARARAAEGHSTDARKILRQVLRRPEIANDRKRRLYYRSELERLKR